ncbi:hypothetical protein [Bifidobacterium aerophilum]|uniref:Uncharacterized protein n=1 Tax=Bifidobacterium aerophilum TaxID=1798155 RepID=A0A6N9Z5Z0_9BIFI|nr:hypothetical protein [Bifidobacterium aerophilum]NEG89820.1 hypothetical protein [Bifidobacterium aerophilum]
MIGLMLSATLALPSATPELPLSLPTAAYVSVHLPSRSRYRYVIRRHVRDEDGHGYGEGTNLEENGDGNGTYVDTLGRLVHYRMADDDPDRPECDSDGNGTWHTSECADMPRTTEEKRKADRADGLALLAFCLVGLAICAVCLISDV